MKKQIVVILSAILVAVTLVVIWCFSAQDANQSSALSKIIAQMVAKLPKIGNWMDLGAWTHVVRKLAHGSIYFVLGVGLAGMLAMQRVRVSVWLVPLLGMALAALDEYHQSFVPGRGPSVQDVMIDTAGVCFGLLLMLALRRHYQRARQCSRKNPS